MSPDIVSNGSAYGHPPTTPLLLIATPFRRSRAHVAPRVTRFARALGYQEVMQ